MCTCAYRCVCERERKRVCVSSLGSRLQLNLFSRSDAAAKVKCYTFYVLFFFLLFFFSLFPSFFFLSFSRNETIRRGKNWFWIVFVMWSSQGVIFRRWLVVLRPRREKVLYICMVYIWIYLKLSSKLVAILIGHFIRPIAIVKRVNSLGWTKVSISIHNIYIKRTAGWIRQSEPSLTNWMLSPRAIGDKNKKMERVKYRESEDSVRFLDAKQTNNNKKDKQRLIFSFSSFLSSFLWFFFSFRSVEDTEGLRLRSR